MKIQRVRLFAYLHRIPRRRALNDRIVLRTVVVVVHADYIHTCNTPSRPLAIRTRRTHARRRPSEGRLDVSGVSRTGPRGYGVNAWYRIERCGI